MKGLIALLFAILSVSAYTEVVGYAEVDSDGIWKCYTEDKTPFMGKDTIIFNNEILSYFTSCKNGKAEGLRKVYIENNLMAETPYKNGKREGLEKRYGENGKLEIKYKDGKAVSGICYGTNGINMELTNAEILKINN